MFSFFRHPEPQAPMVPTSAHRRELINMAFQGATVYERRNLVRVAMARLEDGERTALVRELDREIWQEQKP